MLTLIATDEELYLEVLENADVDVVVSWNDIQMPTLQNPTPRAFHANLSNPGKISLGGKPAATYIRQFKGMYILNKHGTVGATIKITKKKGLGEFQIKAVTLAADGGHLTYTEPRGFVRYNPDGSEVVPA